jgi:hypothetical protein
MQFSAFLDKLQKMFIILEEEGEELSEQAKVCMLLKTVESTFNFKMLLGLFESGRRWTVLYLPIVRTIYRHRYLNSPSKKQVIMYYCNKFVALHLVCTN